MPGLAYGQSETSELLKSPDVTGIYVLYQLAPEWGKLDEERRAEAVTAAKETLTSAEGEVHVEAFLTRGLTPGSDFLLRIHTRDAAAAQAMLNGFVKSDFGAFLTEKATFTGVTRPTLYIHKNDGLLQQLKAGKYTDPEPKYAIMLPVTKTGEWWNLSPSDRMEMIEGHTITSMDFLLTVNRKLYHATGLCDYDFLTFFTCHRLEQFNAMMVRLRSVPEGKYTTYGKPVILGTIDTLDGVFASLQ
jgi:chlorite dismutase